MATTIEKVNQGIAVAEPPVILEPPEAPTTTPFPRRKPIGRWSVGRIGRWVFAGLGAIGIYQSGIVPATVDALGEFLRNREGNVATRMARETRSLGPQAGEQASWWMELPEERIRQLAQLPEINQIGERFVSTVSPALQEKARQAGYKLIYQGDPEDTVGRTVITKGRQIVGAFEDRGFGILGQYARGIFKAWVPDPDDSQQQNKVYALMEDPVTKKQFIAAVDLHQYNPNRNTSPELPTYFGVDDLSYGPDYIREKSDATGQVGSSGPMRLTGVSVPDEEDPQSKKWKKINIDFPEFHRLLRENGHGLSDIARPGDYVDITFKIRSAPPVKLWDDEKGVPRVTMFVTRRFGGFTQWQSEVRK